MDGQFNPTPEEAIAPADKRPFGMLKKGTVFHRVFEIGVKAITVAAVLSGCGPGGDRRGVIIDNPLQPKNTPTLSWPFDINESKIIVQTQNAELDLLKKGINVTPQPTITAKP